MSTHDKIGGRRVLTLASLLGVTAMLSAGVDPIPLDGPEPPMPPEVKDILDKLDADKERERANQRIAAARAKQKRKATKRLLEAARRERKR